MTPPVRLPLRPKNGFILPVVVVALLVGSLPASSAALEGTRSRPQWPPGQWSMFQNTPERRSSTPLVGAQTPNLLWRHPTLTNYGGAVIGRDGTVYVGTSLGEFLAINPDGSLKWSITQPYLFESTPAILLDGRIAVMSANGTLLVLNPDGSRSWLFRTGVPCGCTATSPVVGRDGTIYFTDVNFTLYALHPDGTVWWTYVNSVGIVGPPAVRSDGVVYFISNELIALNPDGTLRWKSEDTFASQSPAIGPDGTIYANTNYPFILYAINPDGSRKWRRQISTGPAADVTCSPAVGPDGTIYVYEPHFDGVVGSAGAVLAYNPDGTRKWLAQYGNYSNSISIGGDGTLYFGSATAPEDGKAAVYALNPDGTLKWEFNDTHSFDMVRTPVAIGDGRVYAGDSNAFFALGP